MTYPEVISYLESFINYERIPAYSYKEFYKLERIKDYLNTIGNPQDNLKAIHIAGTKGKGSTCAFISYILKQAGYRVGLYTSPHLSDFRERIRILEPRTENREPRTDFEGMISQEKLSALTEKLKPSIEKYNQNSKYGPFSFFEVYTALALEYFREEKTDFVVLETGLGGRLDATNVVNPLVCAITPLSYEHTLQLGKTLREIATEKAEIIKSSIVISASQDKEAIEVIRNKCKYTGAKLYEIGKDIFYEKAIKGFNFLGVYGEYPNLEIGLLGNHQLINAGLAVGVIEALSSCGIVVDADSIRQGLINTVWPGRCEVVAKNPLIILDGAQNIASAKAIKDTIKENFTYKKLILVLGISNDKDMAGICREFNDFADEIILTKSNNPRASEPQILVEYFKSKKAQVTKDTKQAMQKAKDSAKKEDLILVTGSLFVVGEVRDYEKI